MCYGYKQACAFKCLSEINTVCQHTSTCDVVDFKLGKMTERDQFVNGPDRSSSSKQYTEY